MLIDLGRGLNFKLIFLWFSKQHLRQVLMAVNASHTHRRELGRGIRLLRDAVVQTIT